MAVMGRYDFVFRIFDIEDRVFEIDWYFGWEKKRYFREKKYIGFERWIGHCGHTKQLATLTAIEFKNNFSNGTLKK